MPQTIDLADLIPDAPAGGTVDLSDLVPDKHPVLDASPEELSTREGFDEIDYYLRNEDKVTPETRKKLSQANRLRTLRAKSKPVTEAAKTTKELAKGVWELGKELPAAATTLAETYVTLLSGGSPDALTIPAKRPVEGESLLDTAKRGVGNLANAAITVAANPAPGLKGIVELAKANWGKQATVDKQKSENLPKVQKAAAETLASAESNVQGLADLGVKAGSVMNRLNPAGALGTKLFASPEVNALVAPPELLSDEDWDIRFEAKSQLRKRLEDAAKGDTEFMRAVGLDAESLKAEGVTVDPAGIQDLSWFTDPTVLIPGAEGFKVASAAGRPLLLAKTAEAAEKAIAKLRNDVADYVANQGDKMVARGEKLSRTVSGAVLGGIGALTGVGAAPAAVAGVLTPPAMGFGGWLLNKPVAGAIRNAGALDKAVLGTAKTVGEGVLAGVVPTSPLGALPVLAAVGSDTPEEKAMALTGPVLGGIGGTVAGKAAGRVRYGADALRESRFKQWQPPETKSAAYGIDATLDAAHERNTTALQQAAPDAANLVNWVRENVLGENGEVYLLNNDEMASMLGLPTGKPAPRGVTMPGPRGDKTRVLLNTSTLSLGHELEHTLTTLAGPEFKEDLIDSVIASYGEEALRQKGAEYDKWLTSNGVKNPTSFLGGDVRRIADEFAAELGHKVFSSDSVSGVPQPVLDRWLDVAALWAERLGIASQPGTAKAGTPGYSPLGVGQTMEGSMKLSDRVRQRMEARAQGQTPPPLPPVAPPVPPVQPATPPPAQPPAAAAPPLRNLRLTPEQQQAADSRKQASGAVEAEAALQRGNYPPETRQVFDSINESLNREQGEVVPVSIEYESVKPTQGGADDAKIRKQEQDAAYEQEALGTMPPDLRQQVEKTTVPVRWLVRGENVNLLAMSSDKVMANAHRIVQKAGDKNADLVPYQTAGGKLTDRGWRDFVADFVTYSRNQANGYAGDGSNVSVPSDYSGFLPERNPTYAPVALDKTRADFLNAAMALPPPKTARGSAAPTVPNIEAAKLATANKRPVIQPAATSEAGKNVYTRPGGIQIAVAETNPLRDQFARRGIDFTGRELFQVTEELDIQRIRNPKPKPESRLRAPNTDLVRAGFMPDPDPGAAGAKLKGNEPIRRVEENYTKTAGLTDRKPFSGYVPVNEPLAKQFADAYEAAQDAPNSPDVQKAYNALATETKAQWDALTKAGYKIEPWTGEGEPYKNSADMVRDMEENKHLWFFATDNGFGTLSEANAGNPLLQDSGVVVNGKKLLVNDLFRGVHDALTHAKEGYQFGPRGEYNAFLAHSRMFSDEAIPALASETMAQNSWVNYGKHLRRPDGSVPVRGDKDFTPAPQRPFADQKSVVLDPALIKEALAPAEEAKFMPLTGAGRELEAKGLVFDDSESGSGTYFLKVRQPGNPGDPLVRRLTGDKGAVVASISANVVGPGTASVGLISVGKEFQGQGVSDALYRELGARLQRDGITKLEGNVITPKPVIAARERVFGTPEVLEFDSSYGPMTARIVSRVDPKQQFMPTAAEYEKWRAERKKQAPMVAKKAPVSQRSPTGWIKPTGDYLSSEIGGSMLNSGDWHQSALDSLSPDERKQFKLKAKADRLDAVKNGFVRVRYTGQTGDMAFEASAASWKRNSPQVKEAVKLATEHAGKISNLRLNLFDEKGNVTDNRSEQLFRLSPSERESAIAEMLSPTRRRELRFMPAPQVDTPEFKNWFGDSKVTDEDGTPKVVYHGTPNTFTEFKSGSNEGFWGSGFYFSDNLRDIRKNYSTLSGPDIKNKIERRAEQYDDMTPEEAKKKATAELTQHEGATMPVFVKMENPLELGTENEPRWYLDYGEGDGAEPTGKLAEFHEAVQQLTNEFDDADAGGLPDIFDLDGKRADEILTAYRNSEGLAYAMDQNGELASGEILRQALQRIGYDGIVDAKVPDRFPAMMRNLSDTVHYIAFDPTQVKSAIGNTGAFDSGNPDIRFMPDTDELFDTSRIQQTAAKKKQSNLSERYPEALKPDFRKDDDGNFVLDEKGKPKAAAIEYELDETPLAREARKGIRKESEREAAVVKAFADRAEKHLKDALQRPEVAAGADWYSRFREKISKLIPNDADRTLFAHLLGASSARTPVADNYKQSVEAFNKYKAGDYQRHIDGYLEGLELYESGELAKMHSESGAKPTKSKTRLLDWWIKNNGAAEGRRLFESGELEKRYREAGNKAPADRSKLLGWWQQQTDLTPLKDNGKGYNANSRAVLRALAGTWLAETKGPKTPNFAGNLAGTTFEATIDVWAARFLHRIGNEGNTKRWRILPTNETGVSDGDFYFGQRVFRELSRRTGVKADSLQAVLWFWEKDHWAKQGWTRGEGAEKSDFNSLVDKTESTDEGRLDYVQDDGTPIEGDLFGTIEPR